MNDETTRSSNHILDLFFLDPNAGDTGVEDFDDDNNKKKGKTEEELLLLTSSCTIHVYLLLYRCTYLYNTVLAGTHFSGNLPTQYNDEE